MADELLRSSNQAIENLSRAKRIKVCLPDKLFHVVPLRGSETIKDLVTFISERLQVEVKSLELLTGPEDDGGPLLRNDDEVIAALGEDDYVLARPRNLADFTQRYQADFTPLDGRMGNFEWNAGGKGKRKWRAYDAQINDELTNAYNQQRGGGTTEIALPIHYHGGTTGIATTEYRYLVNFDRMFQESTESGYQRSIRHKAAGRDRLGHGTD